MAEWAYTIARTEYACPKCGVKIGEFCRTPKGKITPSPHGDRVHQLTRQDWDRCKGVAMTVEQAFKVPTYDNIFGKGNTQ